MNERIRELAEQARNYALDEKRIYERVHNIEQCMEEYREVYNEKFAELIVKECAMLVEGFEITQEVALDEYVDFEASTVLKEHFGVE